MKRHAGSLRVLLSQTKGVQGIVDGNAAEEVISRRIVPLRLKDKNEGGIVLVQDVIDRINSTVADVTASIDAVFG